jgi:metallo-beta-lactamase family protein
MRIHFLGAARTVTGSMHLLETGRGDLLVDCGLYQGRRAEANERNRALPTRAVGASALALTHAHIDHSGSIPTLVRRGFSGRIYCTPATLDLCHALLLDAARIQENDAEYLNRKFARDPDFEPVTPLYTESDARLALDHFVPVAYGRTFDPLPGLSARFFEAGHILGSAQLLCEIQNGSRPLCVLFSGDLGRKGLPILKDPELPGVVPDYALIESTYGDRLHRDIESSSEELAEVVRGTVARGGKVVVPAFAVGRTQELVYALNQLLRAGRIPRVPIFVDSPLSTEVTRVFEKHTECYDTETAAFLRESGDPFQFHPLTYVSSREESMRLNTLREPAVILASSGMCEAGRVLHHLRNTVESERNTILIVGFQAEHTLGRRLVERRPKVKILVVERELHARVATIGAFSAHADQRELSEYAHALGAVKRFFVVHGEPQAAEKLRAVLAGMGREAKVPDRGEAVEL